MNVGDSTHERTGYERGATAVASEEIANSVSAGVGLIAAIAGMLSQPNGAAIALLQVRWSSLRRPYGCISRLRSITRCREIGQSGFSGYSTTWQIFPLIAGTYTPFTLGALRGAVDWTLFAAVWSLAILGIGFIVFGCLRFRRLSVCLYLGCGNHLWNALGEKFTSKI